MGFAYATTNQATGLAASAVTVTTGAGPADDTRLYLFDGKLAGQYTLTAGTTTEVVRINLSSAKAVSAVAILNHNIAALGGGTITIRAATDSGFTTGVVTPKATTTINTTAPKHKDTVLQFASVTKQHWEFTFTHSLSTALKIGELFFAAASTQLTRGQTDGSGERERFITSEVEMQFGQVQSLFLAGPVRTKRIRMQDFTAANLAELQALWRATKGPVTPFLWIESYEAVSTAAAATEQDCIFGRLRLPEFEWSWVDYNLTQPPELTIASEGRERGA